MEKEKFHTYFSYKFIIRKCTLLVMSRHFMAQLVLSFLLSHAELVPIVNFGLELQTAYR
jgi:hypothetical protein